MLKSTFPCKKTQKYPWVVQDWYFPCLWLCMLHKINFQCTSKLCCNDTPTKHQGFLCFHQNFKISVFNFHWKGCPFYKGRDGAFLPLRMPWVTLQLCISSSRGSLCSFKSTQLAFYSSMWLCIYVLVQQATCQKMVLSITEVELEVQTMAFYFRSCECWREKNWLLNYVPKRKRHFFSMFV